MSHSTPTEKTKLIQKKILELRREGMSFDDIGEAIGLSNTYVKKVYRKALKAIIEDDVIEVRKMELEKLDHLESKLLGFLKKQYDLVSAGKVVRDTVEDENGNLILDEDNQPVFTKIVDIGPNLQAIDRIMKVAERRARLLGLDMPTKIAATDPTGEKEAGVLIYLPANDRDKKDN